MAHAPDRTGRDLGLELLVEELEALRSGMLAAQDRHAAAIARVHPSFTASATNLVHYVELRRHDIRRVQERLGPLGLSTLGRAEAHVLATVDAVLATLHRLRGDAVPERAEHGVTYDEGDLLLRDHTDVLLGPAPAERWTRIMVTLPTEAADDPDLVDRFRSRGMDIARVNCAHDDAPAWRRMAQHVRAAAARAGRPSRVAMDLAGPKLRTGPLQAGPKVVKLRPRRAPDGLVLEPWRARLVSTPAGGAGGPGTSTVVPVDDAGWLDREPGEWIELTDARGSARALQVVTVDEHGVEVEGWRTTYLCTGTQLRAPDGDATAVGELPPVEQALTLHRGDHVVLTPDLTPAALPEPGSVARIGCTLPEAFRDVRVGDRVLFDDGRIHGVARGADPGGIDVEITRARPDGSKLRGAKGINLPDTVLDLPALTPKDLADLDAATDIADAVQVSFVRSARDVQQLIDRLGAIGAEHLGVILKIETVPAFERLPELLLTAMQVERVGVMIARGDLAVEAGFERLAEVQEEILWLCEAAHVPVIWATEVLDSLARTGQPSRAEVSDAAMGQRAECVMLNKGPAIDAAIEALSDILGRMAEHQRKKRTLLRRLRAWDKGDA